MQQCLITYLIVKSIENMFIKLATTIVLAFFISGCSNLQELFPALELTTASGNNHTLKSKVDLNIEKRLTTSGAWKYQPQGEDCDDTVWHQSFYKNGYYKSEGSACLLVNAFSVEAENWHVKGRVLYIINLSPIAGKDIILKYGIYYLDANKLVLSSGNYKYTFLK
jgi:hypothetical protein